MNNKWTSEYMRWRERRVTQLHAIYPSRRAVLDRIAMEEIEKPWLTEDTNAR